MRSLAGFKQSGEAEHLKAELNGPANCKRGTDRCVVWISVVEDGVLGKKDEVLLPYGLRVFSNK